MEYDVISKWPQRLRGLMAIAVVWIAAATGRLSADDVQVTPNATSSVRRLEFGRDAVRIPGTIHRIVSLAYSPDGKLLAVGTGMPRGENGELGSIQVWNVETGQRIARDPLPVGANQVNWTSDGRHLVSSIYNSTVHVQAFPSLKQVSLIQIDQSAARLGISPDGTRLVTAAEGYADRNESPGRIVQIWDTLTGKLIRKFGDEPDMFRMGCATWSPGGKYVAAGGGNYSAPETGEARVWDPETGLEVSRFKEHTRHIRDIQFFADDARVATAAFDGTVRIWESATGKQITLIQTESALNDLDISPDGSLIATASAGGRVSSWDVATAEKKAAFDTHGRPFQFVEFSPDGQQLAAGGTDGIVKIWDVAAGTPRKELPGLGSPERPGEPSIIAPVPGGQVVVVAYDSGELRAISPKSDGVLWKIAYPFDQVPTAVCSDGTRVLVGLTDGTVRLLSAKSGEVLQELKGMPSTVTAAMFSADGSRFATGDADGHLWVWKDAQQAPLAEHHDHQKRVLAIGFSAKFGTVTSVAEDGSAVSRQTDRGQIVKQRLVSDSPVTAASFSRDGSTLFVLGEGQSYCDGVSLEPLPDRSLLRNGAGAAVLSADGSHLVANYGDFTYVHGNRQQIPPKFWENPSGNARSAIALSPDDRFLYQATASGGLTVRTTIPISRPAIGRIPREGNGVSVAVSPDGKWLASGGDDSQITLWDLATGEIVDLLPAGGGPVYVCQFSADSRLLATGTLAGRLKVWNVPQRTLEGSVLDAHTAVRSLAFSPDGKWLASGGSDRTIKITNLTTWEIAVTLPDQPLWVQSLAFSPNGNTLYSVTGSWNPKDIPIVAQLSAWSVLRNKSSLSLQLKKRTPASTGNVDCVVATPDSQLVITGSSDGQIKMWNATTLAAVRSIRTPHSIHRMHLIPANPALLAIGNHVGGVSVWDIATGTLVAPYVGHTGHVFDVTSLPNGRCLITAGEDDALLFWPGPIGEAPPAFDRFLKKAAPLNP